MMLSTLQSQTASYTIDDILLEGANAYLNGIHHSDHHLSNVTKLVNGIQIDVLLRAGWLCASKGIPIQNISIEY